MQQTQRICISEICEEYDIFRDGKGSIMIASKIKQFLSETNSYASIKKILVGNYLNPENNKYVKYAFLDVYWHDSDQGKEIQRQLTSESGMHKATIKVTDKVTLHITPISKDKNLYQGTCGSITTHYCKSEDDYQQDDESFEGKKQIEILDENEFPRPVQMYRDRYEEFILDNSNVELDENI
jgi:hypothetical protein